MDVNDILPRVVCRTVADREAGQRRHICFINLLDADFNNSYHDANRERKKIISMTMMGPFREGSQ